MDKYKYINYANDLMQNNDLQYDEYSESIASNESDSINNIFVGGGNKAQPLTYESMSALSETRPSASDSGNNSKNISKPSGGFPPIYLCEKNDVDIDVEISDETKRKREYKTHKTAVSITEIMQRRRNVQPFI